MFCTFIHGSDESFTMARITILRCMKVAAVCFLVSSHAAAESREYDGMSDKIILEVSGAEDDASIGDTVTFNLDQLEALGTVEITTETPWTDGKVVFEGVPISALFEHLGAAGTQIKFVALDDYTVTIPVDDLAEFEPILATRRDGTPMRIRDKGPIWVIYPWSEFPEIQNEENYAKAIWQVFQMTFR